MVVGIAYHSPLDISTFFPIGSTLSLDPKEDACFFITDKYVEQYSAKVQIVFSSLDILEEYGFPILDHGPWGTIVNISENVFEKLLKHSRKDLSNDGQSQQSQQQRYKSSISERFWL